MRGQWLSLRRSSCRCQALSRRWRCKTRYEATSANSERARPKVRVGCRSTPLQRKTCRPCANRSRRLVRLPRFDLAFVARRAAGRGIDTKHGIAEGRQRRRRPPAPVTKAGPAAPASRSRIAAHHGSYIDFGCEGSSSTGFKWHTQKKPSQSHRRGWVRETVATSRPGVVDGQSSESNANVADFWPYHVGFVCIRGRRLVGSQARHVTTRVLITSAYIHKR